MPVNSEDRQAVLAEHDEIIAAAKQDLAIAQSGAEYAKSLVVKAEVEVAKAIDARIDASLQFRAVQS